MWKWVKELLGTFSNVQNTGDGVTGELKFAILQPLYAPKPLTLWQYTKLKLYVRVTVPSNIKKR